MRGDAELQRVTTMNQLWDWLEQMANHSSACRITQVKAARIKAASLVPSAVVAAVPVRQQVPRGGCPSPMIPERAPRPSMPVQACDLSLPHSEHIHGTGAKRGLCLGRKQERLPA